MSVPTQENLLERLRLALDEATDDGHASLQHVLAGEHPADIAAALRELDADEALAIFGWLDNRSAAEALDELDPELAGYILERIPASRAATLLGTLPVDDAAEVVSEATADRATQLLADLEQHAPDEAEAVRMALTYPERTAGRLMTDKYAAVEPTVTAAEVITYLRSIDAESLETFNDIFVLDADGLLVGVCSIRELVVASEGASIATFMTRSPVTVAPETDQEEVARRISLYDLLTIPVVDEPGRLLGIVTVDDVLDVLIEEFTEDFLRMAGTDAEEMDQRTPVQVARLRLPWLLGTMAIELGAGLVIANFDGVLQRVILLASFMPVISAVSGNVGLQAAAIVVRGLDTGHVSLSRWGRQLGKELTTTLLMAAACGVVLGTIGALWSQHPTFGVVIGVAMTCSMLTAGVMGTLIPMFSKRFGFDPATTAGPFETAFQDVIGFAVFLWLASLLEHWLV
jgi:magnesium transporter